MAIASIFDEDGDKRLSSVIVEASADIHGWCHMSIGGAFNCGRVNIAEKLKEHPKWGGFVEGLVTGPLWNVWSNAYLSGVVTCPETCENLEQGEPCRCFPGQYDTSNLSYKEAEEIQAETEARQEAPRLVARLCKRQKEGGIYVGRSPAKLCDPEKSSGVQFSVQVASFKEPVTTKMVNGCRGERLNECVLVQIGVEDPSRGPDDFAKNIDLIYNSARAGNNILIHGGGELQEAQALAALVVAAAFRISKWEACIKVDKAGAMSKRARKLVGEVVWDDTIDKPCEEWPECDLWSLDRSQSGCGDRAVHAAKIVAVQEEKYAVRTLCELTEGECAPEGATQQSPLDDIAKAEAEGATQMCDRCLKYLPASQAVQAYEVFSRRKAPMNPEESIQCKKLSEMERQQKDINTGQSLSDMD